MNKQNYLIERSDVVSALKNMVTFYNELSTVHSKFGIDLEENRGRRNILMSSVMEKFLSTELNKRHISAEADGATGKADIIVEVAAGVYEELECKLTSPHKNGTTIAFQTDHDTLFQKGALDYIYIIANENFDGFVAIHFVGLTVDDFRPVSPGARGKAQMYKHRGMKKARVLFGKAVQLNKKHVQKIRKEIVLSKLNSAYNICKWKEKLKNTDEKTKKFETLNEKIERSKNNHEAYANRRLEKIQTIDNRNERYSYEYERLED